ncbi:hypothetical protein ACW95P_04290, partial [Candidatus Mycoplasma pogonae]
MKNFKNKKYQNIKKNCFFLMGSIPVLLAASIVSSEPTGPREGESIENWVNRSFDSLTSAQKKAFLPSLEKHFITKDIKWVNTMMKDLRIHYSFANGIIYNDSNPYLDLYKHADMGLALEFQSQFFAIKNMFKDDYSIIDIATIQRRRSEFLQSLNKLNGFTNEIKKLINSKRNLTNSQKNNLETEITKELKKIKRNESDEQNNINGTFLAKVNAYKKQTDDLENQMLILKNTLDEYKNKKTSTKYLTSTTGTKSAFDSALLAGTINTSYSDINPTKIEELKNNIINTYNNLDGSDKKDILKAKLKTVPFNEWNPSTIATIGSAIDAVSDSDLIAIETKLNKLGSEYSDAKNTLRDLDDYKTSVASEVDYRLAENNKKLDYDAKFTALKNKIDNAQNTSGINFWNDASKSDFKTAEVDLSNAKSTLKGRENKNKAIAEITSLLNIDDVTKTEMENSIDDKVTIPDKTTLDKKLADLKAANDKFDALKNKLKEYTDTIGTEQHDLATNKINLDNKVIDALNLILESPKITNISNSTNLNNRKINATNAAAVDATIKSIDDALKALDGNDVAKKRDKQNLIDNAKAEINAHKNLSDAEKKTFIDKLGTFDAKDTIESIDALKAKINTVKNEATILNNLNKAKVDLKAKLKTSPFNKLNAATITEFETKINAISDISALTPIETQAKALADKMDEWKAKLIELEAGKTSENYSLATKALQDTFDAELTNLKNKIEIQNIADKTITSLDKLITNAETAKNNLNGLLNKRKQESRDKLGVSPLTELNAETIIEINKQINAATDTETLNPLDTKALNVATAFKVLKDKITNLESYKNNPNYILADDSKKTKFDTSLDASKKELAKTGNILDAPPNTFTNLADEAESAKNDLNGNSNLTATKTAINNLTNLSINQKKQATDKISDFTKITSKTTLDNAKNLFSDIDNKIGTTKTIIDATDNLILSEKTTFKNKLGDIDISDLFAEQAKNKIDEIKLEAKKTAWFNKAIKEIERLEHLSHTLIEKVKAKLNSFNKVDPSETEANFKTKLDQIVNKTKALNNKYTNEIEVKFNAYVGTIGTTKYDEADNKDEQNNAVYAALNEIVAPKITKPSVLAATERINTLKIGPGTDDSLDTEALLDALLIKVSEVSTKIEKSKDALNGENVLATKIANKKKDLIDKVDSKSEFNELPTDDVTNFKNKINNSTSLIELEKLDKVIDDTALVTSQIKQRIEKLKEKLIETNYKLSDATKQKEFDDIIKKLEDHLKENLFDDTKRSAATTDLNNSTIAIAESKLNGEDNLKNVIKEVQALDHLSNDQKSQAETKLADLTKITSKADLETAKTLFANINNKIEAAKSKINTLSHLIKITKDKAIENLRKIDISFVNEATATTKINEIVNASETLNNSLKEELIKLKAALKNYTDEIGKSKHDVTQNVANVDQEVISELKKVLSDITATTLTNGFNVDDKKLSTNDVNLVKTAIANIETNYAKLNGDTEIKNIIDQLDIDPLSSLNDATKDGIKAAANTATSYSNLREIVSKASQAVADNITITAKIAEMKLVKDNANYKLANTGLKNTFDTEITNLETQLKNYNLFNKSTIEIANIIKPINDANAALNGNSNLSNAERDIKALINLPADKQNTIISELKDLTKIDDKTKLDNLVTKFTDVNSYIETKKTEIEALDHLSSELQDEFKAKFGNINDLNQDAANIKSEIDTKFTEAQAINNKFNNLQSEVAKYKIALTQPEYTEATSENKNDQNQKVKDALESVLKDKTYTNIETDLAELTNETYKSGVTLAIVQDAITKITDALKSLNGLTQVNDDKTKIRDKVNSATGIYNPLNDDTKTAILHDIDKPKTDTKSEVNAIDTKAGKTLDLHNRLTAKITELKNFKTDPNYKLASGVEKNNYDLALEKLKEQLIKNLYNDTNSAESEGAIISADAAKAALDGNENLANTKTTIDGLTNLLDSTRTDITTDLDNINKYGYKAALDAVATKFSAINTKLRQVDTNINDLNHLSQAAKDSFINEAKTIDFNSDQTTIETKI